MRGFQKEICPVDQIVESVSRRGANQSPLRDLLRGDEVLLLNKPAVPVLLVHSDVLASGNAAWYSRRQTPHLLEVPSAFFCLRRSGCPPFRPLLREAPYFLDGF